MRPLRRPAQPVIPHANATTDTELSGINTAHTIGDRLAVAAMAMPTKL